MNFNNYYIIIVNLKYLYKHLNHRRLIMKLYSDFSNICCGRPFNLEVTTAEWIWFCIRNLDDVNHIKNEVRALVLEAQHDFDKQIEEWE